MVGDTGIEPVTFPMSRERATAVPIAHLRAVARKSSSRWGRSVPYTRLTESLSREWPTAEQTARFRPGERSRLFIGSVRRWQGPKTPSDKARDRG